MAVKIVVLSGQKGSGKTTIANHMRDNYNYHVISLADCLKDITIELIDMFYNIKTPLKLLHSSHSKEKMGYYIHTSKDRQRRIERISGNMPNMLIGAKKLTFRTILQNIGSMMREHFGADIWNMVVDNKIKRWMMENNHSTQIVIPDCRYKNEYEYFQRIYGCIGITIRRARHSSKRDKHHSERINFDLDHVIENNGSIDDLKKAINEIIDDGSKIVIDQKIVSMVL